MLGRMRCDLPRAEQGEPQVLLGKTLNVQPAVGWC